MAILGGVVLLVGGAVVARAQSEYTDCYATFGSDDAAERAADRMEEAGFNTDVDRGSVTFTSGETGGDARGFRNRFYEVVREGRGSLGHSGNGCIERTFFN